MSMKRLMGIILTASLLFTVLPVRTLADEISEETMDSVDDAEEIQIEEVTIIDNQQAETVMEIEDESVVDVDESALNDIRIDINEENPVVENVEFDEFEIAIDDQSADQIYEEDIELDELADNETEENSNIQIIEEEQQPSSNTEQIIYDDSFEPKYVNAIANAYLYDDLYSDAPVAFLEEGVKCYAEYHLYIDGSIDDWYFVRFDPALNISDGTKLVEAYIQVSATEEINLEEEAADESNEDLIMADEIPEVDNSDLLTELNQQDSLIESEADTETEEADDSTDEESGAPSIQELMSYADTKSDDVILTTLAASAPVITKQPVNATGSVGDSVKFTVEATGVASYQWQYSKNEGKTFSNAGVSGNKTKTIKVDLTETYMSFYWRCVITGENGDQVISEAVTTETATSSVVITKQPVNVQAAVGDTVKFSVEATGAASYQWQYSKNGGSSYSNAGVSGNKTKTISVKLTETYMTFLWRCAITGEDGTQVYSDAATIGESASSGSVTITKQPVNVQAAVGDTVKFNVEATGAASYQWQYSKNGGSSYSNAGVSGNKTKTMSVKLTETYMTFLWRCAITGEDGTQVYSKPATVGDPETTDADAVKITQQPANVSAAVGDTVKFSVEATGAASYQWQYSKNGGSTYSNAGVTGNKTKTITVNLTETYMTFLWRCVITGKDGEQIYSDAATVEVPKAPAVITKQPENVKASVGDTVKFSVEATDAASYQWQYSKNDGKTYSNAGVSGNKTKTITVNLTETYITFLWRCVITGTDGQQVISDAATVTDGIVLNDVVYKELSDTECYVESYKGSASTVYIPSEVDGMTVVEIGEYAFADNATVVSITLPSTIRNIGAHAFENCAKLSSISE